MLNEKLIITQRLHEPPALIEFMNEIALSSCHMVFANAIMRLGPVMASLILAMLGYFWIHVRANFRIR